MRPLARSSTASFIFTLILMLGWLGLISSSQAQTEKRIALVVGNAAYPQGALATPANDAGLIAQTLQAAGFDVSGARDLDGESLRASFRDFLDKVQASGPDTVAFIYLAGYGLQLDGENYFVPVDARIAAPQDIPAEALRISDYTRRLSGLPIKAGFVVLDAASAQHFIPSGPPLAGGLVLIDPDPNLLIAFNASPSTVAPSENGPYGPYAQALTEMIREGGLAPTDLFDAVRLRVSETSQGALVPWDVSRIAAPFLFFERKADAPPPAYNVEKANSLRSASLRLIGPQDAYVVALERDTVQGYEEFLAAYPDDPLAKRVHALVAARREAITWRRTSRVGTPDAYWSYLIRYPLGPHADDARRRLLFLSAELEPPPAFTPIVYDVPPPPLTEIVYVDRSVLPFSDPAWGFGPPPPPIAYLAPAPSYLVFPPPPPPIGLYVLPQPAFVAMPIYVNPPAYVAAPPQNVIFQNLHNAGAVNRAGAGQAGGIGTAAAIAGGVAAGATAGAIATRIALPPSLASRAGTGGTGRAPASLNPGRPLSHGGLGTVPAAPGRGNGPTRRFPAGHELPGTARQPLQGSSPAPGGSQVQSPGHGRPISRPAKTARAPVGPTAVPTVPSREPTQKPTASIESPKGHRRPGNTPAKTPAVPIGNALPSMGGKGPIAAHPTSSGPVSNGPGHPAIRAPTATGLLRKAQIPQQPQPKQAPQMMHRPEPGSQSAGKSQQPAKPVQNCGRPGLPACPK